MVRMRATIGLKARFERDRKQRARTAIVDAAVPVSDADLARLPPAVRRYLRAAGVVGRPQPRAYQLAFSGRIRGGPDELWMPFRAEQYSAVDGPVRLFYMRARRAGVPIAVYHRYVDGQAEMHVKLAGLVTLVDAHGPVMDRSETVTVFNDMCLLAPGTLLDRRITWRERDDRAVDAIFSVGEHTIAATLTFDESGLITNFESLDRSRSSADGRTFTQLPFLTPVGTHATFNGVVVARQAQVQWRLPDDQLFTYGEFTLESITFIPAGA
jgi:hypothetical protein